MNNFLRRLFGKKNATRTRGSNKSQHPYDFQTKDTDGFRLCVTLQASIPLELLNRHCEEATKIPETDSSLTPSQGVWIPKLKEDYSFLDEGASMSSAIGYVPQDGGDLLKYLKAARRIIEHPLSPERDLHECMGRIESIKELPMGHKYVTDQDFMLNEGALIDYFPLVFGNEEKLLRLILQENNLPELRVLSLQNILNLISKGYSSVRSVIDAEDNVLLELNGIGEKKLQQLRNTSLS